MKEFELINVDPDEIYDLIHKIEMSFGIEFSDDCFDRLVTFGDLCNLVISEIRAQPEESCTSQQAFYKLRRAFAEVLRIDGNAINLNTEIIELLGTEKRRGNLKSIETELNIKLDVFGPSSHLIRAGFILFLVSLIILFFSSQIGVTGILVSILGMWLANKFGSELKVQTLRDLAEKMVMENYMKSRRNNNSFNPQEIETLIQNWFRVELDLDKSKLGRDSLF